LIQESSFKSDGILNLPKHGCLPVNAILILSYYLNVCKESMYYARNRSTEHSKGNKTVPEKVATSCTEDGQKTDCQNKHYNINQKEEGT